MLYKAKLEDVEKILEIYEEAKRFMIKSGNPDQWDKSYPSKDIIISDIRDGILYKYVIDNCIEAVTVIDFNGEESYNKIVEGGWSSNDKYATIHRLAIGDKYRGKYISDKLLNSIFDIVKYNKYTWIRVDTHRKNLPMQKYLIRNGFKNTGIIYIRGNLERLAFERKIGGNNEKLF